MRGIFLPAVAAHSFYTPLKLEHGNAFIHAGKTPVFEGSTNTLGNSPIFEGATNTAATLASAVTQVAPQFVTLSLAASTLGAANNLVNQQEPNSAPKTTKTPTPGLSMNLQLSGGPRPPSLLN